MIKVCGISPASPPHLNLQVTTVPVPNKCNIQILQVSQNYTYILLLFMMTLTLCPVICLKIKKKKMLFRSWDQEYCDTKVITTTNNANYDVDYNYVC